LTETGKFIVYIQLILTGKIIKTS